MIDPSPSHRAIVTTALTKKYNFKPALDHLTLEVKTGSIFGFLGPNGAGKTTTIRLLLGFIAASTGNAAIFGHDPWKDGVAARRNIGFLVQADAFYPDMTGNAQLDFAARLSGRAASLRGQLLEVLDLSQSDLDRKFGEYSKGMKQKLALVAAAQHDPPLLILDEPTDGLDPLIQRRFLQFLHEFHARGRTIFMSSHDLSEVDRLCETVAIVRDGRLVALESIDGIRRMRLRHVEVVFAGDPPPKLQSLDGVSIVSNTGRQWILSVEGSIDVLLKVLAQSSIEDLTIVPPSLDDVFMTYYDGHQPTDTVVPALPARELAKTG